jgi:replicative DNA helicase
MQSLYRTGLQPLSNYNIFIDDTPALTIYDLKTRARKLKKDENIGLLILDYLQLMSGTGEEKRQSNREQEISNISRNLKGLAKELKIPIIALSQLSRALEKEKRDPQLSDLRESGAIEQDADMVGFLTRPDYQATDMTDESVQHFADIHIKKHRNGDLAKIPMRTMLNIQRWMTNEDYDRYNRNLTYGNFRPVKDITEGARVFIQTGSKMNSNDEPDPF